jgi:hypothetical protein
MPGFAVEELLGFPAVQALEPVESSFGQEGV